ncbi:hypothetical protein BKA69DRAFT_1123337 [Paraphysoderma sedebokerense]|nr:hypothetical protein BKA69DRAFT_1123337 [Paraphysoderma sedebokerense]
MTCVFVWLQTKHQYGEPYLERDEQFFLGQKHESTKSLKNAMDERIIKFGLREDRGSTNDDPVSAMPSPPPTGSRTLIQSKVESNIISKNPTHFEHESKCRTYLPSPPRCPLPSSSDAQSFLRVDSLSAVPWMETAEGEIIFDTASSSSYQSYPIYYLKPSLEQASNVELDQCLQSAVELLNSTILESLGALDVLEMEKLLSDQYQPDIWSYIDLEGTIS